MSDDVVDQPSPPLPELKASEGASLVPPWDVTPTWVATLSQSRRSDLLREYEKWLERDAGASDDFAESRRRFLLRAITLLRSTPPKSDHSLRAKGDNAAIEVDHAQGTGTGQKTAPDQGNRKTQVDDFIARCNKELRFKVQKKHIVAAAKHTTPRQFQHWQANDGQASSQDERIFAEVLALSPHDFHARLVRLRVPGIPPDL